MVVIPLDDGTFKRTDDFKAFVRTGIVAYNIPRSEIFINPLRAGVVQHHLERIDVGMDIAQYSYLSAHVILKALRLSEDPQPWLS